MRREVVVPKGRRRLRLFPVFPILLSFVFRSGHLVVNIATSKDTERSLDSLPVWRAAVEDSDRETGSVVVRCVAIVSISEACSRAGFS